MSEGESPAGARTGRNGRHALVGLDIIVIASVSQGRDGKIDPRIIFVNPGFARLTCCTAHAVIDRNRRFLPGPDTDPEECREI